MTEIGAPITRRDFLGHLKNAGLGIAVAPATQLINNERKTSQSVIETESSILELIPEQMQTAGEQLWKPMLFEDPKGIDSAIVRNRLHMSLITLLSVDKTNDLGEKIDEFHTKTGLDFEGLLSVAQILTSTDMSQIQTEDFPLGLPWETSENPGDPNSQNTALELWAANHIEGSLDDSLSAAAASEAAHDLAVVIAAPNTYAQLATFIESEDTTDWANRILPTVDEFRAGAYNREAENDTYKVLEHFTKN